MSISRILQIIAFLSLALGAFILFNHFTNEGGNLSPLGAMGAIISGIAALILSKSKAFKKEES